MTPIRHKKFVAMVIIDIDISARDTKYQYWYQILISTLIFIMSSYGHSSPIAGPLWMQLFADKQRILRSKRPQCGVMMVSLLLTWISVRTNHRQNSKDWPLQWRHNGRNGVSDQQPYDCLLNRLFRRRSNKTSKLRVTGLCEGNSPVTGEFPAQRASYSEYVSIWRRHHVTGGFAGQRDHNAELWWFLCCWPR